VVNGTIDLVCGRVGGADDDSRIDQAIGDEILPTSATAH